MRARLREYVNVENAVICFVDLLTTGDLKFRHTITQCTLWSMTDLCPKYEVIPFISFGAVRAHTNSQTHTDALRVLIRQMIMYNGTMRLFLIKSFLKCVIYFVVGCRVFVALYINFS